VGEHVNAELDVLLVGVRGRGEVLVDGRALALGPGDLVLVPRGARRGTRATTERFAYLTVHRRRQGLRLGLPPRS
jgi:quercetin dioxygenase-like cupin family protein